MIYPSKTDWWLGGILLLAGLGLSGAGIMTILQVVMVPGMPVIGVILGLILFAAGLLVLWQLFSTGYEITSSDLIMRSGPFRWTICLSQIIEVYSTRHPPRTAARYSLADHFRGNYPALSLDRLRINYRGMRGNAFYLISPRDKSGFLHELSRALPGLQMTGHGNLE
jgi:hypothetical protein